MGENNLPKNSPQFFRGSFTAVWTATIARKDAFCSIFEIYMIYILLHRSDFKNSENLFCEFSDFLSEKSKMFIKNVILTSNFDVWKGMNFLHEWYGCSYLQSQLGCELQCLRTSFHERLKSWSRRHFILFNGILKELFSYFRQVLAKIHCLINSSPIGCIKLLISKIRESTWQEVHQTRNSRYGVTTKKNRMTSLKIPLVLMKQIILQIVLFGDAERSRLGWSLCNTGPNQCYQELGMV